MKPKTRRMYQVACLFLAALFVVPTLISAIVYIIG